MRLRLLLLVLFLGFGAIAIGWVYESSLRQPQDDASLVFPNDIDYFLTNMRYRQLNADGRLDFEFYTPRMEHYPLGDISEIEVPSMQIATDSGPWQVDAIFGEFHHQQSRLDLRQKVVMLRQGDTPIQIYTESISFEPDRELVSADSEILMLSPQARITAQSAEFDFAAEIYRFDQARAVYRDENS
jgi:LPS export ABC transporter protein LptC